jgi:hypothetical protein
VPFLVVEIDLSVSVPACLEDLAERAGRLTEVAALCVHMGKDVGRTGLPDNLGSREAGDPLGSPVPVTDDPLPVDDIKSVVQFLQQVLYEAVIDIHVPCPLSPALRKMAPQDPCRRNMPHDDSEFSMIPLRADVPKAEPVSGSGLSF